MVGTLWLVYLINVGFVFYGSNVINTAMVQDLGMSRKTLGAGFALFHLIQSGLSAPFVAMIINRRGVRFAIILGSLIVVAGALAMTTVVNTPWMFLAVFSVVIALGVGFGGVLTVQTGVTFWFERKRALAMSLTLTAAGIGGFVAAPALNGIIAMAGNNWRIGWFLVAGLSAAAMVISALFVKNRPSDLGQVPDGGTGEQKHDDYKKAGKSVIYRTDRRWTAVEVFKTASLWLIFISIVGFFVPYLFCVAHGVIYLIDKGFPQSLAAISLGLITLFSIIGRLVGGVLGDRIEPRYIWAFSVAVLAVGVVSCMYARSPAFVFLYTICVGFGFGAAYVLMPTIIGNYFGAQTFASIMGTLFLLITLFSSASPFVGGVIHDWTGSYTAAFTGALAFAVTSVIAILAVRPPQAKDEPESGI